MRTLFVCLCLTLLLLPTMGCEKAPTGSSEEPKASQTTEHPKTSHVTGAPFLAIWMDDEGYVLESKAPYLRVAIWDDGRIQFAQDPKTWNHNLRQGRIDPAQVAALKAALVDTGVFDLKGTCYLVPDAPRICMMLNLSDKQQMLYWDEHEMPGYGINIDPKPRHRAFMRCWKEVKRLAIQAIPNQSEPLEKRFLPPQSWCLKRPIQSE